MAASPHSPNWHWDRLGYTIEREKTPFGSRRTIRRPDGSVVEIDHRPGDHPGDAETRAALKERLPHGAEECAAAQPGLFDLLEDEQQANAQPCPMPEPN